MTVPHWNASAVCRTIRTAKSWQNTEVAGTDASHQLESQLDGLEDEQALNEIIGGSQEELTHPQGTGRIRQIPQAHV